MIVTCEECSTSFQLDEARIPPGGARVRCSRCKHAFFLPNPNESAPADPVHSIAEEAAADANAGTPEASRDLNEDTWDGLGGAPVDLGDSAPSGVTEPLAESAPAATPEPDLDDEEDWQFSEEVRVEGDDDLDEALGDDLGADAGGELDFGGSQDFSEGFDESALSADTSDPSMRVAPTDEPEIANAELENGSTGSGLEIDAPAPAPAATDAARDESSFGSVDDFSSLMEDDDGGATDAVASLASEIASELEAEVAGPGHYASGGQSDDLGDPESWDLVGSDDFTPPPTGTATAASAALQAPIDEDAFFNDDAFEAVPEEIDLAATALATGPVGHAMRAVGWVAAAAATALVTMLAFQAEWARFSPTAQVVSVGPITAQTTESGWVETLRAGSVLRVAGEVRNTTGRALRPSEVQIALLDAAGERLPAAPIRAGIPLAASVLRESPPDVLAEQATAASRRFARSVIQPGEALGFEALVAEAELPAGASRALLEVGEATEVAVQARPPVAAPQQGAPQQRAPQEASNQAERSSP